MHKLQEYQPDAKDPIKRIGRIKRIKNTGIATESPPDGVKMRGCLDFEGENDKSGNVNAYSILPPFNTKTRTIRQRLASRIRGGENE